ncbi:hypothetical protein G7Y89_g4055 [Cudoniella acicularis]|uniref:F-box domain-containing protein n=1 Tax=Cudoniella acicularis TaxID=354080 RepID=A0A8H4RS97_9HELO|nr:hypothetical protein G7Y89_g4055 [Cudoniella acicularis]
MASLENSVVVTAGPTIIADLGMGSDRSSAFPPFAILSKIDKHPFPLTILLAASLIVKNTQSDRLLATTKSWRCCQLCGVSFNIGRIRRPDEPKEAAWNGSPRGAFETWVHGQYFINRMECGLNTGCCLAIRQYSERLKKTSRIGRVFWVGGSQNEEEDGYIEDDDGTYEYKSDEGEEPFEHDLNASDSGDGESGGNDSDTYVVPHIPQIRPEQPKSELFVPLEEGHLHEYTTNRSNRQPDTLSGCKVCKGFQFKYGNGTDDIPFEFEHIAGPGCVNRSGYNGFSISTEEMKGCNTVQCLVPKDSIWKPSPEDEDFERGSNFFLSGISDRVPSRDENDVAPIPARHNVVRLPADDCIFEPSLQHNTVMPFHPSCFEIYKRASRLYFGYVNINDLIAWRSVDCHYKNRNNAIPRAPAVTKNREQWWRHERGTEYLAANPVLIPGLNKILEAAVHKEPSFSTRKGAFPLPDFLPKHITRRHLKGARESNDPFLQLPREIIDAVVGNLGSRDIANLRLATPAFRQLGIYLFYGLIKKEMPWLWEAWSVETPSFWALTTAQQLREEENERDAEDKRKADFEAQLRFNRDIIKREMPEVFEQYCAAEPLYSGSYTGIDTKLEAALLASTCIELPKAQTNWYQLYCSITLYWPELKGLQNRARIWKDVEEIISRMKRYREEGKI